MSKRSDNGGVREKRVFGLWLVAIGLLGSGAVAPRQSPDVRNQGLGSTGVSFAPGEEECDLAVSTHGSPMLVAPGADTTVTVTVMNVGGTVCNSTIRVSVAAPGGSFAVMGVPAGVLAPGVDGATFEYTGPRVAPLAKEELSLSVRLPLGLSVDQATFCASVTQVAPTGGGGGGQVRVQDTRGQDANGANDSSCSYVEVGACVEPGQVSDLVGWWPFDGDANDASSYAHNGTVSGGSYLAIQTQPRPGQSLYLQGAGVVQVASSAPLDFPRFGKRTIDAWVKPQLLQGTKYILAKSAALVGSGNFTGYALYTEGFDLRLALGDGTDTAVYSDGGSTFPNGADGVFTHVTVVADLTPAGPSVVFYRNGTSHAGVLLQGAPPTGPLANNAPLRFGQDSAGGSQFRGQLADVLMFDRAFSPAEAANLNLVGKQPLCP